MRILAIDPGSVESGWVIYDPEHGRPIEEFGIDINHKIATELRRYHENMHMAIERIECFGQAVGRTTFSTVWWEGRFCEAWPRAFSRIPRREVKKHICPGVRAKDKDIRAAMIAKFGPPGTKREPGLTYGLKSHLWQALAIAVTCAEKDFGLYWKKT